jgi:hypothetical protein
MESVMSQNNNESLMDKILSCCGNTSEEWTRGDAIGLTVCFVIAIIGLLVALPLRLSEMQSYSTQNQDSIVVEEAMTK